MIQNQSLYRPDGPAANRIRGMTQHLQGLNDHTTLGLIMALAQEVDMLRETLAGEIQRLQDQVDDHFHPSDGDEILMNMGDSR